MNKAIYITAIVIIATVAMIGCIDSDLPNTSTTDQDMSNMSMRIDMLEKHLDDHNTETDELRIIDNKQRILTKEWNVWVDRSNDYAERNSKYDAEYEAFYDRDQLDSIAYSKWYYDEYKPFMKEYNDFIKDKNGYLDKDDIQQDIITSEYDTHREKWDNHWNNTIYWHIE